MLEYKKIDLHLHFDGSLPIEWAWETAQKELGLTDKEAFIKSMQVDEDTHSLYDYLARFDMPLKLLQSEDNLYEAMKALILELDQQGLLYAEIRFAPQQHIKQGLSQKQVVDILCQAREDALRECTQLHVNFILCMMILGEEKLTHELNEETLYLAKEYQNRGVVAVDLAGAEGMASMEDFRELFMKAKELGLVYTIHAGESYGPMNIEKALSFGALRIGHGTSAIQDEKVMELLKEKKVPLEVCITSNVHSEAVNDYEAHPIKSYLDRGILICICTDNMTISDTNLDKEYDILLQKLGFTMEDLIACNQRALESSFASEEEKQKLLTAFRSGSWN